MSMGETRPLVFGDVHRHGKAFSLQNIHCSDWISIVQLVLSGGTVSRKSLSTRSETRPVISPTVVQNRCPGGEHLCAEGGSFRRITGWTLTWSFWSLLNGPITLYSAYHQRREGTSFETILYPMV